LVTNLLPIEHKQTKIQLADSFGESYGVTSYGSGWRKKTENMGMIGVWANTAVIVRRSTAADYT